MPNLKTVIKPRGHFMQNRALETILGLALVLVGCLLLYDAWDARGKKMPWPMGGLAPW